MAAETLIAQSVDVHVYDAMPSVGRKFLMAGIGGMNITHAEPAAQFITRYGDRKNQIAPMLEQLNAASPVSYTHLDVYKRQRLITTMPYSSFDI